jgi:hypothetical protein
MGPNDSQVSLTLAVQRLSEANRTPETAYRLGLLRITVGASGLRQTFRHASLRRYRRRPCSSRDRRTRRRAQAPRGSRGISGSGPMAACVPCRHCSRRSGKSARTSCSVRSPCFTRAATTARRFALVVGARTALSRYSSQTFTTRLSSYCSAKCSLSLFHFANAEARRSLLP